MFAKILKIDIFHDEKGRFALINHATEITKEHSNRITTRFNTAKNTPVITKFTQGLVGRRVDTRIFPKATNINVDAKITPSYVVGKDALTLSTNYLKTGSAVSMGATIGDYLYQNIVNKNSLTYHDEMLHTSALDVDISAFRNELSKINKPPRNMFSMISGAILAGSEDTKITFKKAYPHSYNLAITMITGGYFKKTA